ncbi:guanylate-binding protein 3-like [Lineus longissimus]|uniref:guanylate-binding protein 3-like n=1 Tax=Lineus longissimus TaxID=88925 RepID=UPI00315D72BB
MASSQTIFNGAKNFIKTERASDGKYMPALNKEALDELKQVTQKLVVVSAVGPYRTGKSYLLSRLSKLVKGPKFTVGHKSEPQTKGLWLMIIDHPGLPDCKLALLDTEGVGDTKKGDTQHDAMLFVLTCLLSDTMIYNGSKAIDEVAFEKLKYDEANSHVIGGSTFIMYNNVFIPSLTSPIFTAEMSKYLISREKNEGDDDNFYKFFPELIYVIRDCHVGLEENGREITPDEYFESALTVDSSDDKTGQRAKTRNSIKKYFRRRKCFTLDIPAAKKSVLSMMDTIADDQLNEDFIGTMNKLLQYILFESKSKVLQNGRQINGRQVAILVETYVNAYRNKDVPNISSALQNLKAEENRRALEQAESIYGQAMDSYKHKMPTESKDDVEHQHKALVSAIEARIYADVILQDDEIKEFIKVLEETLNAKKIFYIEENERLSKEKCDTTLQAFYRQLQAKKVNEYNRPGGYEEYRTDMSNLEDKYSQISGLGVMKKKKLLEFLEEKRTEEDAMLAMDNALTEKERQLEEQKRKTEQSEREKEELQMQRIEEEKRNAELLEDGQKQNDEKISDMKRNMKDEAEKRLKMEEEYTSMKEQMNMQENQAVDFEKLAEFKRQKEKEASVGGFIIKGLAGLAAGVALGVAAAVFEPVLLVAGIMTVAAGLDII